MDFLLSLRDRRAVVSAELPHPTRVRKARQARPTGGIAKRAFDVATAGLALATLSPLFVLLALAIKLSDGGPVFYRHMRIGKGGSAFHCLKLRTMIVDADTSLLRHLAEDSAAQAEWAAAQKLKNDPRVTPLGTVLRKLSLDELPQLVNVIRGDMSIVGPRPVVQAELEKYGEEVRHYLATRPGLTGPWQISGRNDVSYATRVQLDVQYVENWSFVYDVRIIARTIPAVLRSRGVY